MATFNSLTPKTPC